jgi:DnaK suppressor protein
MNDSDIEKFRQKLVLQRTQIQSLEATLKESSQTVVLDQSRVGRVSRMDAMQGQQMALEASRRRQQQLKNIIMALDRIEKEEYGFCLGCGEPIDSRRLDFDPACSNCIQCAE